MNLSIIKSKSVEDVKGKKSTFIIALIVVVLINNVASYLQEINIIFSILSLALVGLLQYGYNYMSLKCSRNQPIEIADVFYGFKDFVRISVTMFLEGLYILLWSMLFLIPGIIKVCSYCLTPYILVDYPELSYNQAIKKSCTMMNGHKWSFFCLCLSYIGWIFLGIVTLGIAYLYIYPVFEVSKANFYQNIKNQTEGYIDNQNMSYNNQNQMNQNQNMGYNNQNQMNQNQNMSYNNQNQMNQNQNMSYNNQNQMNQNVNNNNSQF